MLDQDKFIASQAIMKSLIESGRVTFNEPDIEKVFKHLMGIMENYATIAPDEEFINTNIPIEKQFWNQSQQAQNDWLTEWGKPMPIVNKVGRKEWFIHCKNKDMAKLRKVFAEREASFDSMVQAQGEKQQ